MSRSTPDKSKTKGGKLTTRSQLLDKSVHVAEFDDNQLNAIKAVLQKELSPINAMVTSNNGILQNIQGQINVINDQVKTIQDDLS